MAGATNQEPTTTTTTTATTKSFLYHPKYNSKQTQPNAHNKPITKPPPMANQSPQTTTTITRSSNKFQIQKPQQKRKKKKKKLKIFNKTENKTQPTRARNIASPKINQPSPQPRHHHRPKTPTQQINQ